MVHNTMRKDVQTAKWLQVAIGAEKMALRNYLDYAHATKDRTGKDMFIKLARDEFGHMDALEKELVRISRGRGWQALKLPASAIEKALPSLKKGQLNSASADKGEVQALTAALQAEKKAMEFYLAKSRLVTDNSARRLLGRLADMEEAHHRIIQAELDSINKTGFWMGIREISFET